MVSKRFMILALSLAGAYFFCWVFLLGPWAKEVRKLQQKIRACSENIALLYEGQTSLAQASSEAMDSQNQKLKSQLEDWAQKLGWQSTSAKETGVEEFRLAWEQKKGLLARQANKLGITIEESLGFPSSLPSKIEEKYWMSLELGYSVLSRLLAEKDKSNQLQAITKVHYPKLEEPSLPSKDFFYEYPMEITLACSYGFLIEALHRFSQIESGRSGGFLFPYLVVTDAVFSPTTTAGMIQCKITLATLKIQPQAEFNQEVKKPTTSVPVQNVPIWERY